MAWQRHRCWSIACDICGDGWPDGYPHFDQQDDASEFALSNGWVVTELRAVCPACLRAEACAITDHRWGPWTAAGPFPTADGGTWQGYVRHCDDCGAGEWDPPVRTTSSRSAA